VAGGVLVGGPGWVMPGVLKMLGGALLAYLALTLSVPADRAVDPNQMYVAAYELVFPRYGWAVAATALLVVVSQLKINVTNAYAGSLAWSNFFARVTHSHPGRVVWMVFNTLIALMLMELEVFKAIGGVLGLYSNIAISWIMAVVADLVVNKPLGLSPQGIEFKRAHLYDINPVGVGAMGAASVLSMLAWGRLRADGAGLLGGHRDGRGLRHRAADRLGDARPLLHRPPGRRGRLPGQQAAKPLRHLRARLRRRRHGALPGLWRADLQPVLQPGRALPRPVQAARGARAGAGQRAAAPHAAAPLVAAAGHRPGPLPAADVGGGTGAGGPAVHALPGRTAPAGRQRRFRSAGAARLLRQGLLRAAAGGRRHRLVAGAGADQPPGGAGGVQPPDRGAGARDRQPPPHRRGTAARRLAAEPPATWPMPPTRPRRATSRP
jgi:hypothetical protein